ncbi:MAG TPA: hypothetical protein VGK84_07465 [Candidatus Tumulicola sp.]
MASASENLYVLYAGANAVVVYTHNGKQVLRTITDGIHSPDAMAIDSQGTLYVGNLDHSSSGAVKVYPPGTSTPTTTITVRGRQVLACDASGNLYIGTDKTNVINVYSNQGTTLVRTLTGIRRPVAIAFDAVGNVYAGNVVGINVYEAGGTKLLRTIPSTDAYALAFDSTGELYVLSAENETVEEFAPNGSVPDRTITEQDGLYYPNAIALDDHNYLYVANCGTCQESTPGNVTVYAPKQTSVSRTIDRGVDGPYAIAYDNPDFYVGNRRPETVTMYRHGKPRLVRTISPPSGYGVAIVIEFGP